VSLSPHTTARRCPHFPACPGCPLVALPYRRQLAAKRARVEQALTTALARGDRPAVLAVVPAPAHEGYRIQTKLVAHAARGRLLLGLYRPESHHVVDVSGCPLHAPLLRRAIPVLRDALADAQVPVHGRERRGVRYVLIRASGTQRRLLVTLVSSRVPLGGAPALARRLRALLPLAGLALNENTTAGNEILGPRTIGLWGEQRLTERFGDVVLSAGPTAFVQANAAMAARIYAAIAAAAGLCGEERVVDLYAGTGGIALALASRAREVLGIEEVESAVDAARANARRNRRGNARFVAGRVEEGLADLGAERVDLMTLNPPRKGCGARVAHALAAVGPRRILYLSCCPETFARDAAVLIAGGYALGAVRPFDLLPQTEHVELLGTFTRPG
jgi:23S rRNA (uracil1939-C5)-methyltransferase